ncbi:DUF2812 domain-containing protein [Paenalkalicoccus suaedae]|uniref:DUF2812 domain-containing protein n=1 Tax=Paenalkalicoccus suaedae TaxID=2592382 RepID=A0A859FJ95_9BACI|nr:DUF2812 domain-containing protein [Paenalkalicoccus suaedae]QKS72625.1 DUF2812 domain-containing protein [Paenalkalicoccus suaedae]
MREDTVKRRWLWSIDIRGTELWLADLEAQGYRLTHLDAKSSKFVFEKAEPRYATLMVRYKQESLGDNWTEVASDGHWQIVRTTKPPSDSATPMFDSYYDIEDRKTVVKRNEKLLLGWILASITIFFIGVFTINYVTELYSTQLSFVTLFMWYAVMAFQGIFFAFSAYLSFLLQARTQELRPEGLDRTKEVRWKQFSWFRRHTHEDAARWLEDQEADGWQLYSCSRNANRFVFKRATPQAVSYSINRLPSDAKVNESKTDWEHIKNGSYGIMNWSVHRKYYDPTSEEKPRFINNAKEKKKVVEARALIDGGGATLICVLMMLQLYLNISTIIDSRNLNFNMINNGNHLLISLNLALGLLTLLVSLNFIKYMYEVSREVS